MASNHDPRRLRFLSYAVNGAGVGHVVRQVAIQKWLRRLCAGAGVASEHWFLTTSEADSVVFREGFAAFKLPSKTIVEDAGVDKLAYIAMARQWVWNSVTLLRPDVFIVDTFPGGSFQELGQVLDLVGHRVLIERPVKGHYARLTQHQARAAAYDLVLIPEDPPADGLLLTTGSTESNGGNGSNGHAPDAVDTTNGDADAVAAVAVAAHGRALSLDDDDQPEPALVAGRRRYVGPVMRVDPWARLDRESARRRLGIPADAFCVLVTGGGGGDAGVEVLFDDVENATKAISSSHSEGSKQSRSRGLVHILYAAGPLYRGRPRHGAGATFFVGHDLAEHLAAVDVAVTAAGFNTLHELQMAGVPAVVVPQHKIADDQRARAERAVAGGAATLVEAGADLGARLAETLTALWGAPARLAAMAAAGKCLVPHSHARDAALAIMAQHLRPSMVRMLEEVVDDDLLARLADADLVKDLAGVMELALCLAGHGDRAGLRRAEVAAAVSLLSSTLAPPSTLVRLHTVLSKRCREAGDDRADVTDALRSLCLDDAINGQWNGLLEILTAIPVRRGTPAHTLVATIQGVAARAAREGVELGAMAHLVRAMPTATPKAASITGQVTKLRAVDEGGA